MHTVLVIGGYGFFGARIAVELARNPSMRVLRAGRAAGSAVQLDAAASDLPERLHSLGAHTVVHTAGPFQGQNYAVAQACIDAGCNYMDLADGRAFVAGIGALDAAAKTKGVTVISGASSVPALSSAVVDRYLPSFSRIDGIRAGISSGARAPGPATVRSVFGYCGKPIRRMEQGSWVRTHGWLELQRHDFPSPVGGRWLGSIDVPDLELFPERYGAKTVTFHAGFPNALGHLAIWALAGLVRFGVLPGIGSLARPLNRVSRWLEPIFSDKGGMFVELEGLDRDGSPCRKRWHLLASQNHGPYIPCGASLALIAKLAAGVELPKGAMPCMSLLTIDEYLEPLRELDIRVIADPV